jgi:hypothetical protein
MPRLASSLTTRTRRARPSENTDLRVIPGFSPRGHPSSDHQSGGGAGSARPRCRHNAKRNVPSFRAPASFQLVRNHGLPRLASGQYSRTRRPRPSEKTASRAISRPFPARPSQLGWPSPRRGGLRTPANETLPPPRDRPIRPPGFRLPPMVVLCLGLRTALQCGRGDRAPPRESPSSSCLPTKPPNRNPCLARLSDAP